MDISRLLNQSIAWEAVASTNDRDDPIYASPVTLPCRVIARLKDIIGKDGEVTTATNQITIPTSASVSVGDLLGGREVVAITTMVDYSGNTVGQQALTR